MKQNKKDEPVYHCLELRNNVAVENQVVPIMDGVPETFVEQRVADALQKEFIPDNMLYVIQLADETTRMFDNVFDLNSYTQFDWEDMADREDVSLVFKGSLREAAFCVTEYLKPTMANIETLSWTERFAEFIQEQNNKQWEQQNVFIANLPPEQRYDDWSFVFGMTDRTFTDEEKQDIQALGSIMTTGLHDELMTQARFPSLGMLRPSLDRLDFLLYSGLRFTYADIPEQKRTIKVEAGKILSEKYPEIADTMKDLCGQPTGKENNEVYVLLKKSGELEDLSTNGSGLSSFYNFLLFNTCERREKPLEGDYTFIRYRLDDLSMAPTAGLSEKDMWRQLQDKVREKGIEPMNKINFGDALYCMDNNRNPMHPDNCHEKLILEKAYQEHCRKYELPVVEKNQTKEDHKNKQAKAYIPEARKIPVVKRVSRSVKKTL